jgi:hypothetical protein
VGLLFFPSHYPGIISVCLVAFVDHLSLIDAVSIQDQESHLFITIFGHLNNTVDWSDFFA